MVERILKVLKEATAHYDALKKPFGTGPTFPIEDHPTAGSITIHSDDRGIELRTLLGDANRERYPGGFKVAVDDAKVRRQLTKLGYKVRPGEFGANIYKNAKVIGTYQVLTHMGLALFMHRNHAENLVNAFFGGRTPAVTKKEE